MFQATILRLQQRQEAQPAEAKAIKRHILRTVDDERLSAEFCERVAWAVVEGAYPRQKLERILQVVAVKHTAPERGRYFIGAIRRSFEDAGVPLERRNPPEGAAP